MSRKKSAYEVLGIASGADDAEIRQAYRRLAGRAHPDRHDADADASADAHERFLEIKAAYEVLIDPVRRTAHDEDPEGVLAAEQYRERRRAQIRRRRNRLRKLYDDRT
ncbi:MAG: DnaJ domain-containing protein [Deltaproteobacteria bacterium]|nr:DnaJ domain-containing protein [Deltaproteobacteria bacterium]